MRGTCKYCDDDWGRMASVIAAPFDLLVSVYLFLWLAWLPFLGAASALHVSGRDALPCHCALKPSVHCVIKQDPLLDSNCCAEPKNIQTSQQKQQHCHLWFCLQTTGDRNDFTCSSWYSCHIKIRGIQRSCNKKEKLSSEKKNLTRSLLGVYKTIKDTIVTHTSLKWSVSAKAGCQSSRFNKKRTFSGMFTSH